MKFQYYAREPGGGLVPDGFSVKMMRDHATRSLTSVGVDIGGIGGHLEADAEAV
jgi:hypothetical protein